MDEPENELESFRQKWREEVSARKKSTPKHTSVASSSSHQPSPQGQASTQPPTKAAAQQRADDHADGLVPQSYHDLEPRESGYRLGDGSSSVKPRRREPQSALEHYEDAVERESVGKLGDSVKLYRQAFKLDSEVHELHKNKHFPASSFPPKPKGVIPNPPAAQTELPSGQKPNRLTGLSSSLTNLLSDFSKLSIQGEEPPTELSPPPPCPIASIPEEILTTILLEIALDDVAAFSRMAQVCKRMAYLVLTEDSIWKRVAQGHEFGFAAMHYSWACTIKGDPLMLEEGHRLGSESDDEEQEFLTPAPVLPRLSLVPDPYPNYRSMFRLRPRLRFNGCYISTVNYTRSGGSSENQILFNTPVLIVTYYRYLRFFRNGTVISLLTTAEPADVVHYLTPEYLYTKISGGLPQAVMKDALAGRWRLSGPDDLPKSEEDDEEREAEGLVHIETDGSTPKYMFKLALAMGSAGRGARNNKLAWQGYWDYNKTTDDWAEFGLKHDKPFYWSRVKSYGSGL